MLIPYLGSAGATLQDESGHFTFASPEGDAAVGYLVDLINKEHVAPSAADTNDNGDFSRDQFLQGKIALFQSGAYNLANVAEGASFEWGLAPQPKGPAGAVTVGNSIVAAGSTASANPEAQHKLQATWTAYWSDKGVDTAVMAKAPSARSWRPSARSWVRQWTRTTGCLRRSSWDAPVCMRASRPLRTRPTRRLISSRHRRGTGAGGICSRRRLTKEDTNGYRARNLRPPR